MVFLYFFVFKVYLRKDKTGISKFTEILSITETFVDQLLTTILNQSKLVVQVFAIL